MTTHIFEPMQQKTNTHSSDESHPKELPIKKNRKTWKKPADKPKRPPSAYNLYFQLERERLLANEPDRAFTAEEVARIANTQVLGLKPKRKHRKSHGKISFTELARVVAKSWKELEADRKTVFEERAAYEKKRYLKAVEEWAVEKRRQQERETMGSGNLKPSDAKAVKEDLVALSVHASSLQQSMNAFMQNIDEEEQLHTVEEEVTFEEQQESPMCAPACNAASLIFDMALQMNIQPQQQQQQQEQNSQLQFYRQMQQPLEPLQSENVLSASMDILKQFDQVFQDNNNGIEIMQQRTVSDLGNLQRCTQAESTANAIFGRFDVPNPQMYQQNHQELDTQQTVTNFYHDMSSNDDSNFAMCCSNFFQQ